MLRIVLGDISPSAASRLAGGLNATTVYHDGIWTVALSHPDVFWLLDAVPRASELAVRITAHEAAAISLHAAEAARVAAGAAPALHRAVFPRLLDASFAYSMEYMPAGLLGKKNQYIFTGVSGNKKFAITQCFNRMLDTLRRECIQVQAAQAPSVNGAPKLYTVFVINTLDGNNDFKMAEIAWQVVAAAGTAAEKAHAELEPARVAASAATAERVEAKAVRDAELDLAAATGAEIQANQAVGRAVECFRALNR